MRIEALAAAAVAAAARRAVSPLSAGGGAHVVLMSIAASNGADAQLQPLVLPLNLLKVFFGCNLLPSLLSKLPKMLGARLAI